MDLTKFDRQLRLLLALTLNEDRSIDDISTELGLSRRSTYRYIEAYRDMGFIVKKKGMHYTISHESPFFQHITSLVHFSDKDGRLLARLVCGVVDNSTGVRELRKKLFTLYGYPDVARTVAHNYPVRSVAALLQAITEQRSVVLRGYTMPGSSLPANVIVEPYLFLPETGEIRAYDVSAGVCRTFRMQCVKSIGLLDFLWSNTDKHTPYFTDIFRTSGEQHFSVSLRLGRAATNYLLVDMPMAEDYLSLNDDGTQTLQCDVAGYKGVGRFVLGFYDDITILGPADFRTYIEARIRALARKVEEDTRAADAKA